jgi:transposase
VETAQVRPRPARPGPRGEKGGGAERAAATLAAGGEVWVGDETALREFPPLRAAWSQRGAQAAVVISGRNARRTVFGALRPASGELVGLVRERARTADAVALVEALGAVRPEVPKLLVRDNAPPHHPRPVKAAALAAGVELVFLPFRSPEPMPLEELWRGLKQEVAANRCSATVDELAERAAAWLEGMDGRERRRRCGLDSSKFDWLPTEVANRGPSPVS